MSPGPWLLLAAALLVMSFILLTPAVGRMMSKAFPNDRFASLDAPGTSVSGPVHFKASMPLDLRAGAEGLAPLYLQRKALAAHVADIIDVVTADASHANEHAP